jgi:beta-glucosidase
MTSQSHKILHLVLVIVSAFHASAFADEQSDHDRRAASIEAQMTDEERFPLIWGYMPTPSRLGPAPTPPGIKPSAGYFPPIKRFDFPGLHETDASLGVTNPKMLRKDDVATALPSGLALAASFDANLAFESGAMIGGEARAKGFNVLLAGGVNLTRDWFGGRNFEYLGEDPLLAGTMAGQSIRGIQAQGVISTAKHFALNSQETLRHSLDARISEADLRESDLLAFEIALEQGRPGAIMCAYNRINGVYGCSNTWLLNRVLRQDWGFKGWVMSDWGATHGPEDMSAGLDQQSGAQLDKQVWFDRPLREAVRDGRVTREAISTSVRRILRSVYAVGANVPVTESPIDFDAHAAIARRVANAGIVLLKNDGVLPLTGHRQKILVVGRFADRGVWSGGGSSQVIPVGAPAARLPYGGSPFLRLSGFQVITPSSPLEELRLQLPEAILDFDTGYVPEMAAARAAQADVVIVFASKWQVESLDAGSLNLPEGQDSLIEGLARANSNVVVVLETGNPVAMPWLNSVRAVVQAWYSGQAGGAAIADILTGKVNPSGRLPMTFPRSADQAPRSMVPGMGRTDDGSSSIVVDYAEGSDVGYRWYAARGTEPLFPFGFGLSYTTFGHENFRAQMRSDLTAIVTVTNRGKHAGADTPQLYLVSRNDQQIRRLLAFNKVRLNPGESRTITLKADPRLLAEWTGGGWTIASGRYGVAIGKSATELGPTVYVKLPERTLPP